MNAREPKPLDEPGSAAEPYTYDLNPLRDGPDALETHDFPDFKAIHLCELDLAWEDPYHLTAIIRGDSLFSSPAAKSDLADLIPPRAILTGAAFEIQMSSGGQPCGFEIHPPSGFKITRAPLAHLLHRWLLKHHFLVAAAALHALLGLALPLLALPLTEYEHPEHTPENHPRRLL